MVFSGTQVYIDNLDILIESKCNNSLLLANHGSRIDWMVGMYMGHLDQLGSRGNKFGCCSSKSGHSGSCSSSSSSSRDGKKSSGSNSSSRCRVGFVCEALIQMMPLIGWYRKIMCDDIFVWRSFDKDAPTIKRNISNFHQCNERRMLFLSPEGVVVDHGEKDIEYVHQCRQFCVDYGIKPFDYVLTPRHKGTTCLLDQIANGEGGGTFSSVCLAFVRDGKLLNCKLLSASRIIPDIYDLNQGVAGKPISIYVHIRKQKGLDLKDKQNFDAKARLMEEYQWKDSILSQWDKYLQKDFPQDWGTKFTSVEADKKAVLLSHFYHVAIMLSVLYSLNMVHLFFKVCQWIFFSVGVTHTLGWLVNKSSMESVPFETGIKALVLFLLSLRAKEETTSTGSTDLKNKKKN